MAKKTSIHLKWDRSGKIEHQISGVLLPQARDDPKRWVLAPSPILLLAHQFGVLKPSHGLIVSARAFDLLFYDKYILLPINSALRAARIDLVHKVGPSVGVRFHARHPLFANSDSVEEGVRQLLNNYTHHVSSKLGNYMMIVMKTFALASMGKYLTFLQDQYRAGRIARGRDKWYPRFSAFSAQLIAAISATYYVPQGGRTPDNEEWARKQTSFLKEERVKVEGMRDSILTELGLY